MIKALVTDVSKVLLFPKDKNYSGSLNALYKEKALDPEFKFFDSFELNTNLLSFYKSLKKDLKIFILTSDIIQDASELQPYWKGTIDDIFSASKMGVKKSEPDAYKVVLKEIKFNPEEVIYTDDIPENIEAAKEVGLQTILYKDNEQVISAIETLTTDRLFRIKH